MAVDCLAGYLYASKMDGTRVSKSSDLKGIDVSKIAQELELEKNEYFVNLVTVDVEEYAKRNFNRSVKKTLTIPEWLNKEAIRNNINFSQVLQEALIEKLRSK